MADEEKDQTGSEGQPPQDAGTTATDNQQAEDAGHRAEAGDTTEYKTEFEKLQASHKELQGQFTTVSQEAAKTKELLQTLEPYIDYGRLPTQGQQQQAQVQEGGDEEEETYMTAKQVRQLMTQVTQSVREEILAQNVRTKYPDVCDNGPNEVIVRWHLQHKTSPHESAEKRIEKAVEMTREMLKAEREKGKQEAEAERQKAQEEAKARAAAAAKAGGLGATGVTSPHEESKPEQLTGESYIESRRARREKTRSVSP